MNLCIKILVKTLDSPSLDSDKLEMCVLELKDKKPNYHQLVSKELNEMIKEYQIQHANDITDDD